jgi:2-(1,2-epoxy-1,2-dihydrophenyl)acetyl-CoA isomerase
VKNLPITLDIRSDVAILTLNRPDRLNAIDEETIQLFPALVEEASANEQVTYLVLRGNGSSFCSGGGLDFLLRLSQQPVEARRQTLRQGQQWVTTLLRSPCMVIAAVNGLVVGAGTDVVLAADAALLGPYARFNLWFAKVSAIPDLGGLQLLSEVIGPRAALHEYARGETMSPARAQELGIGTVVDEFPKEDARWSVYLRKRFPIDRRAFSIAKQIINQPRLVGLAAHQEHVAAGQADLFGSEAFQSKVSRIRAVQNLNSAA